MNLAAVAYGGPQVASTGMNAQWRFGAVPLADAQVVRNFIQSAFRKAYDARIDHFLPELHALHRGDALMAACGLRHAARETLFLEIYLDRAVEVVLAQASRQPVERARVVEVGNLSIALPGVGRHFIRHLTAHLHEQAVAWTVFTAVPALRNSFQRLGIPVTCLGPANADRIPPDARRAWGRYYDQGPLVCAVEVAGAHAALCP